METIIKEQFLADPYGPSGHDSDPGCRRTVPVGEGNTKANEVVHNINKAVYNKVGSSSNQ